MLSHMIRCENCATTATKEGHLPMGWFTVLDYLGEGKIFCSLDCIYHYVGSKKNSDAQTVPKERKW